MTDIAGICLSPRIHTTFPTFRPQLKGFTWAGHGLSTTISHNKYNKLVLKDTKKILRQVEVNVGCAPRIGGGMRGRYE